MSGKVRGIAANVVIRALAVGGLVVAWVSPALAGLEYKATVVLEDDVLCMGCVTKVTVSVPSEPICKDCHQLPQYCPPIGSFYAQVTVSGACFVSGEAACEEAECVAPGSACLKGTVTCPTVNDPDAEIWACANCNDNCGPYCQAFTIAPGESKTFWIMAHTPGYYTINLFGARPCGENPPIRGSDWFTDQAELTVVKVDIIASLPESQEIDPGWYMPVNWDDDNSNGWTNNGDPPDAIYTPDKDDDEIITQGWLGGDNDLVENVFLIDVAPDDLEGSVNLTFPAKIKVWETPTKKTSGGASSEVASGTAYSAQRLSVPPLFMEGVQGSDTFRDVELKAKLLLGGPTQCEDILKVTVFEVDLVAYYSGEQEPDNDKRFSTISPPSSGRDLRGKISWDDANGNGIPDEDYDEDGINDDEDPLCQYFHNNMELQGTLKPAVVPGQSYPAEFNFKRDKWERFWWIWNDEAGDPWDLQEDNTPWKPDDGNNLDEDLTPSNANHIYAIDGPGFKKKSRQPDKAAQIVDFRERVLITLHGKEYQASDWYKWHSQLYVEPKNSTVTTRSAAGLQKLGSGWITVPNAP